MPKADLVSRFLAALIDAIIAGFLCLVPLVGFLAAGVYTLVKDGIMYELTKNPEYKDRSLGKKLLRLKVLRLDGGPVDIAVSAKRNLTLGIGGLIGIVPLLGWVIGPFVSLVLGVVELLLVLGDPLGRRLGDKWAGTQVVAETAAPAKVYRPVTPPQEKQPPKEQPPKGQPPETSGPVEEPPAPEEETKEAAPAEPEPGEAAAPAPPAPGGDVAAEPPVEEAEPKKE